MGLKFAEILEEVELPPGVVNIVTGPGSITGNMIANHPGWMSSALPAAVPLERN